MNILDLLGWGGAAGLLAFYWFLGSQKIGLAYTFGIVGGVFWLAVGIVTAFWTVQVSLPSLIFMEAVVIIMNVRGIVAWRKKKVVDR
jgi:hypothetical protein